MILNPRSVFKADRSACYSRLLKEWKILHQKRLRGLCIAWYSILRALKHYWFVFFRFFFKSHAKEVISLFWDENKTLQVSHVRWFGPQGAVITTVFLTLWLAGHWRCDRGRKSINNGVLTGNLVPRAHVPFGQHQDTELWNNQQARSLEPTRLLLLNFDTTVLSKPDFDFHSFSSAYWMHLWNLSTSALSLDAI